MAGFNGTTMFADNVDFSGSATPAPQITADGQLLIGSTAAPNIRPGTITSTGGTIDVTYSLPNINLEVDASVIGVLEVNLQTGTTPIVPTAGAITFNGSVVAAGSVPVQTDGTAADTMTLEIQLSQAIAATDITKVGLCNFDSADFAVDANGFVTFVGVGAGILEINLQTGTSPITPTGGAVTLNGAVVAAGTHPVRTNGTAADTGTIEVQISQAVAASDATTIGLANFDSSFFSVDANGFVSLSGSAGFSWIDKAASFAALAGTGYFVTANATATLPAIPSQGNTISFAIDSGSAILTIQANTGQFIKVGKDTSASAGICVSNFDGDSITLVYRAASSTWIAVDAPEGTWTVT